MELEVRTGVTWGGRLTGRGHEGPFYVVIKGLATEVHTLYLRCVHSAVLTTLQFKKSYQAKRKTSWDWLVNVLDKPDRTEKGPFWV